MGQNGTNRGELSLGMQVEINPQHDRSRKQRVSGIIKDILTNTPYHSHGILVSLESGVTGRVKKIISSPSEAVQVYDCHRGHLPETPPSIDLQSLITKGENHFVEFKSSILWSTHLSDQQMNESPSVEIKRYHRGASKFIIAKTLAGFLNSEGGNLLIGVKENKSEQKDEIIGIESEFSKLQDQCIDGYRRMILDQIVKLFFPVEIFHHFNDYMRIMFDEIDGKTVCCIQLHKSDRQVFITHNKDEYFFVRIDASTRELHGADIVNYCMKRFS